MKSLLNLIMDLFAWIFGIVKRLGFAVFEKFLEINIFEKGVVLATLVAFAAVVAPMARYMIFGGYIGINNPAAHYLIGIAIIMLVTIYFPGHITLAVRTGMNLLYLIDIIYLQSVHDISKAPYELTYGYYLNIVAPIAYIALALGSAFFNREA
jgi:hypothetical protein